MALLLPQTYDHVPRVKSRVVNPLQPLARAQVATATRGVVAKNSAVRSSGSVYFSESSGRVARGIAA